MEILMPSNYTETLNELLKNKHYGEVSEDASLSSVLEVMRKFPNFVFDEDELSMLDLFIDKYDIKEIGAETEELFLHFWKERANELYINYAPKIKMWLDNFNDLFKFTVALNYEEDTTSDRDGKNTYYLNPVSVSTETLKVQDVEKNENSNSRHTERTRDVLQSVWGKTRAQLLEQIFDLKNLYMDCLNEFSTLFMGVL